MIETILNGQKVLITDKAVIAIGNITIPPKPAIPNDPTRRRT